MGDLASVHAGVRPYSGSGDYYKLIQAEAVQGDEQNCGIYVWVFDEHGVPELGHLVTDSWPGDHLTAHTKGAGYFDFYMNKDSGFSGINAGPHELYVGPYGAPEGDVVTSVGLWNGLHTTFQLQFKKVTAGSVTPPTPPSAPEAKIRGKLWGLIPFWAELDATE